MDPAQMLSKFVTVTKTDPGLAQDLLEGQNWNYDLAMQDFKQLQDIGATPPATKPVSHSNSGATIGKDGDKNFLNKPPAANNGSRSPGAPRKLVRGISKANARIVGLTRQAVVEDESDPATGHHLVETPVYTFVLPDLDVYHSEFRSFIEKDLLEMTTMVSLENANVLNWWSDASPKLWPMATTGDGNCLLHAASLGMWGFHDRQLTLRKALYHALTENSRSPRMLRLKRRWRWQQALVNKESGLVYSEQEWEEEWKGVLKLASAEPRLPNNKSPTSSGAPSLGTLAEEPESPTELSPAYDDEDDPLYESLEEFHVFVLANILQRPIIVVADTVLRDSDGEAFAPIPFGGIYLPLDCQAHQCQKTPLVLTYDAAHFSALVPMENTKSKTTPEKDADRKYNQAVIPVTDQNHQLLPLHFSVDPGPNWQWNKDENDNSANPTSNKFNLSEAQKLVILKRYLNLVMVPIPGMKRNISVDSTHSSKSENGFDDLHRQISSSSSESETNGTNKKLKKKTSFGQKLKFFSGLEKDGKKKGKVEIQAASQNSLHQNPRVPQITTADLEDLTSVVGAKMTERRHQLHDEMIHNYLQRAKLRFEDEQKLLRLLENETLHHQQVSPSNRPHQRQRISDAQQLHHEAANARLSHPSSQIGNPTSNHNDLPLESHHHNPRREGIPNRYPANGGNKAISPTNRGRPVSQPINYDQVPRSTVYIDRRPDQRHNNASNHIPPQTRHKGYSPPHHQYPTGPVPRDFQPGMRPAPQDYPPGMRPAPQNRTSPDARMSDSMLNPQPQRNNHPGNRSPVLPKKGRPVSQPPMQSNPQYNSYDMNKVNKALPQSNKPAENHSQGLDRADGGGKAGTKPCRSSDCDFYGTQATDFYCSKCYQTKAKSTQMHGKQKKRGGAFWKK